jgi:hypothetical protein
MPEDQGALIASGANSIKENSAGSLGPEREATDEEADRLAANPSEDIIAAGSYNLKPEVDGVIAVGAGN